MEIEKLVALLQNRDPQGAEALLRHWGPLIRYVIAPILPDVRDREECLSQVAMQVWENIGNFDPQRGSWKTWLTAIARNAALNRARGQGREEPLTPETPSAAPTPEETVLERERMEVLGRALLQLTQEEQALLYRKYYYHQSTAQMAAELGTTERAVEGRLYRIKKRLRREMGGDWDG